MARLLARRTLVMAVMAGLCLVIPMTALAASTFKTGHYTGSTSQHKKLTVSIVRAAECTAKTYNIVSYCLGTITQAYLTLKCPDGTTANTYIDVDGSLNAKGVISYTAHGSAKAKQVVYLKDSPRGTITGWVDYTQAESIEGTGPVCTSGKVTFKLRHT